ncbi:MAG: helix-hairpin-helix domain-containing protein, partial [Prevotella sp.]|nr:helix-hairpin-helix domain-containing protein [Prevotella sp.]
MLFFLPISSELRAQIDDVLEDLTTIDDIEAESWEQTYDLLSDLLENPLNLNTATPDDLRQLPFLSEEQIEEISEYIYRYGALLSEGELAMIPSIDETTRQRLMRFTFFGDSETKKTFSELLREGRHELIATGKIPFYERRGDREAYLGPPYKHSLRYTFQNQQRLKAGFIGSQDAG